MLWFTYHAESWEKWRYDRTAWNNPRAVIVLRSTLVIGLMLLAIVFCSLSLKLFDIETVHCSNNIEPGSGIVEYSKEFAFCLPTRQSEQRRTSILTGTLFCHNKSMCLRKFSSFLHWNDNCSLKDLHFIWIWIFFHSQFFSWNQYLLGVTLFPSHFVFK